MRIKEIDDLIDQCSSYLKTMENNGEILGSHLTQYLIVRMYRSFEEQLREIVINRVEKSGDNEIVNYVKIDHKHFRGISTSDIQEKILRKFGQDRLKEFQKKVSKNNIGQSYNSIISNRHSIVHSGGTIYATFSDTVEAYNIGHRVFDMLREVFGL